MSTNFARSFLNKCFLHVKNHNVNQIRLDSFKAAVLKEKDAPLEIDSKLVKKLEKNQVRVQVNYCSVNTIDVAHFKSEQRDFVPGYEFSGEVLEVGDNVKAGAVTVGERVAVLSRNRGGFAEQCVVDAGDVWRLSSNIKRKDAAVLIFGHTNAIYAFSNLCPINEKSNITVATGPAGLGLAAIDVAANVYNAKPFGICESEELSALVRERGAFKTATFKTKNLPKICGNSDVIYDAVGGEVHKLVNQCVKQPGGKIIYAGPYEDMIPSPPVNSFLSVVNIECLRDTNYDLYRQIVSDTLELADQGIISAYVSAEFTLSDIDKAIKFIEEKKCTGKVLIKVVD